MPFSEHAYYDVGLSDFQEEKETSKDCVDYENHRLETVRFHSGLETSSEKPFKTESQDGLETQCATSEVSTLTVTIHHFYSEMEGI